MARRDHIYRNATDTVRVRVFQRETGRWDYDVFTCGGFKETWSEGAGDNFRRKVDALAWAKLVEGVVRRVTPTGDTVTSGMGCKPKRRRR
jgi:hypothetical protein